MTGHPPGYLAQPVGEFLDGLAAAAPAPAGGSAAALSVALAAALCAKSARLSSRQLGSARAEVLSTEGENCRAAAAALIDADALAYGEVIEALRVPRDDRPARLTRALSGAADVPMRVTELAADVAGLAVGLAAGGNPRLRGDALTALYLAEAGARSAVTLVGIDVADFPGDERLARAQALLAQIERLATGRRQADAR